ncbi:hypothetical protein LTR96_003232 [Exophiala xenobiotica]|nr:hypothetical protein LTR96_003232 [Exophiala xenobiotica]KAK5342643.1 hypothetical protein LTR98_000268 [Exophiala xenobiotica]KAK5440011.1 hypothetical protein LTR18_007948 [Exophiala xenobiotica]KAK5559483.1 hypothetical protein LTR46_002525 [Exophiala xenobiotica]
MTNPPTPPNKRLFGLPPELNDQIISKLNYEDLRSLRATCHSASELIPLTTLKTLRRHIKAKLLDEEATDYKQREIRYGNMVQWAREFPTVHRTWYTNDAICNIHANFITRACRLNCYACLQTLPRECFTDSQVMGSRSLGHKDAERRFCKVCGVKKGIWARGTTIKEAKGTWVVCKGCAAIRAADSKYKRDGVCSAECLARVNHEDLKITSKPCASKESNYISQHSTTTAESNETKTFGTRATRCLRCWSINHTEKVADGELALHLCKGCEALTHTRARKPSIASGKSA